MSINGNDAKLKHKLSHRHQALQDKIHRQRDAITSELGQLQRAFAFADNGLSLFTRLKQKPLIGFAAIAALWLLKPSRILAMASKGFAAWQIWRSVAPLVSTLNTFKNRPRPPKN